MTGSKESKDLGWGILKKTKEKTGMSECLKEEADMAVWLWLPEALAKVELSCFWHN